MINRSSAQGRRSTEEDSNTMTTPTFNAQQLDIPETAVADPLAPPRQSQRGGIDTARFWVGAALTAGISALVALIALIITNDLLHIPVMISEGGRLVMIGFGAYALFAAPRPGRYFAPDQRDSAWQARSVRIRRCGCPGHWALPTASG